MVTLIADSGETRTPYTVVNEIISIINGFTPSGGERPYSYVILTDGTYYYAYSGFQVLYGGPDNEGGVDGEDLDAVIAKVISVCGSALSTTPNWDSIYLQGTLHPTAPITINRLFIRLIFDALILDAGNTTIINLERQNGERNEAYIQVYGGYIKVPASYTGVAVCLHNCVYVDVDINAITNTGAIGTASIGVKLLSNKPDAGYDSYCAANNVKIGLINGFETDCLLTSTAQWTNNNTVKIDSTGVGTYGVRCYSNGGDVHDNTLTALVNAPAVGGYSFWTNDVGNVFLDCKSIDNTVGGDFYIGAGAHYTRVIGGTTATTPVCFVDGTARETLQVHGCRYWVVDKSGSTSVTGAVNIKVVTHGLFNQGGADNPWMIEVSAEQNGQGAYCVSAFDATTFTITFATQPGAGTWYFFWRAKYTP